MEMLEKEEVLHVAHLAQIEVTEEEIKNYQIELKQLLDEVEKINEIKCDEEELLITPIEHHSSLRKDENARVISFEDIRKNAPKTVGNFVEVPVMINE